MKEEVKMKVDRAIRLVRSVWTKGDEPVVVAYSGGKDSDVILELVRMAGIGYKAVYRSTTIDPPGTIMHAMRAGAEIRRPEKTFFQLVAEKGSPSRFSRFCCEKLKEYNTDTPVVILGIRRDESQKRKDRYKEPVVCNERNRRTHQQLVYPILDWTIRDEEEFIRERGIRLHHQYYRKDGSTDLTRRLGCLCCPLMSHGKRMMQFQRYPGIARLYIQAFRKFLSTHPNGKTHAKFQGSAAQWFAYNALFEVPINEFFTIRDGLVPLREEDFRRMIVDQFGINALPKDMR